MPVQDHTNYYYYLDFIFLQYHSRTTLNTQKDLHYITLLPLKQTLMCLVLLRMTVAVPYLT